MPSCVYIICIQLRLYSNVTIFSIDKTAWKLLMQKQSWESMSEVRVYSRHVSNVIIVCLSCQLSLFHSKMDIITPCREVAKFWTQV
jgi:hypothetical protein